MAHSKALTIPNVPIQFVLVLNVWILDKTSIDVPASNHQSLCKCCMPASYSKLCNYTPQCIAVKLSSLLGVRFKALSKTP